MSGFVAEPVLARLKDFQRRTVDYVFRRMYLDEPPALRFLVADEVGLGKTLVAKGVIAKALEHLNGRGRRIDIVYVCSNAAIARQNINRLNVLGKGHFSVASRLTLLPTEVKELRANPVNFISFTPGTTFDLKSRGGWMKERAVIFRMLRQEKWVEEKGLLNILQGTAGRKAWKSYAYDWVFPLDEGLTTAFRSNVRVDRELRGRIVEMCGIAQHYSDVPAIEHEDRYSLIGDLRKRLARVCLNALKPDLIILDEFQRFRNLLQPDDPAADLAQELFRYPGARVLLLSATPYKMLSLDHEQDDDHYPDFLKTLGFLFDDPEAVERVQKDINDFRCGLLQLDGQGLAEIGPVRDELQSRLLSVMCRTERVAHTDRQDAMMIEPPRPAQLTPEDLHHAAFLDHLSRVVKARDAIEYWKSTPYALNFMRGYEVRTGMEQLEVQDLADVAAMIDAGDGCLLRHASFEHYQEVDPANPRLRSLMADTVEQGLWRVLWLPPSLPYWRPGGSFSMLPEATKSLVFSAWNAVPEAIAALVSYEAERRMLAGIDRAITHQELYDRLKPLLRFSQDSDGRLVGMPALVLLYPSPTLAELVDPVQLSLLFEELPPIEEVLDDVEARIKLLLDKVPKQGAKDLREDERWYWALPPMLDALRWPGARSWCFSRDGWRAITGSGDTDGGGSFHQHIDHLLAAAGSRLDPPLGRPPADLARVIAELALAGPGVCALRSLHRVARDLSWDDPSLLEAAARVATGFRTLFNLPESIALLRGKDSDASYWRIAIRHGLEGNLPALLDEQIHVLLESLGHRDATSKERVQGIAIELAESLSIRSAQLSVDEINAEAGKIKATPFRLRCRFALRFGELRDEKTEQRIGNVRSAFNSPFRPFVLASTSIGQEGLDFHTWCHAVFHWNLPSNPVDLEQREGRVHRYKGHAVRKNVARMVGRGGLRGRWELGGDPWETLFAIAREHRDDDLLTYWLFEIEGGSRVERRVPLLPFSRETAQLKRLKRGLALYRLVFGQPRQEDLMSHLSEHLAAEVVDQVVAEWRIDLTPPAV